MATSKAKRRVRENTDQKQLELESFRAVSGGEYVRSRLIHALALGDPSVERVAYAIKSRVKRVDSLMLKVLSRQKQRSKQNYQPKDARDIVGFRLLTLFRNELPLLVRRVLDFIETSQKERLGLFVGSTLRDCILEIRIYGSSLRNDENMELCVGELMDFGFSVAMKGRKQKDLVQIEIDQKPSEYSSIHIVALAIGPLGQVDTVPVEIQLRTSLEDVWGEIDHRIIYKEKSLHEAPGDTSEKLRELHSIKTRVRDFKRLLDSCSNIADSIESDINRPAPLVLDGQLVDLVSIGVDRLLELRVGEATTQRLRYATDILIDFSKRIATGAASKEHADALLALLSRAEAELSAARVEYSAEKRRASRNDRHIRFRIGMEIALCHYWRAVLLMMTLPSETAATARETSRDAIRRAMREYLALATQPSFNRSAALAFRMAMLMDLQRDEMDALSYHEKAFQFLENDNELDPFHYLHVRIPRQYGVAIWKCAFRLERESIELGDRALSWEKEREYYVKALEVTLPIHGRPIVRGETDRATMTTSQESAITANNIVYYSVAFLECGGSWDELRLHRVSKEIIKGHVSEIIPHGLRDVTRILFADTLRLAAKHLGDDRLRRAAARKVINLHGKRDLLTHYEDIVYHKMLKDARDDLSALKGRPT